MKKLIVLLAVVAFVATAMLAFADNGPAKIKFEAKMGAVTFDHAAHQAQFKDCKTCHHKGVEAGACRTCHLAKKGDAPKAKDAFHKQCKGCHKKMKKGPTKCKQCHVK